MAEIPYQMPQRNTSLEGKLQDLQDDFNKIIGFLLVIHLKIPLTFKSQKLLKFSKNLEKIYIVGILNGIKLLEKEF